MNTEFDVGDVVRVVRNVRDDGTVPGATRGELLVRRGSLGHVVDIGTFLMDQIIYSVHFLDANRIVGCREEELLAADAPWAESAFETRERVRNLRALSIDGEVRVPVGAVGEVLKVIRDKADDIAYHVHFEVFPGRTLQVRERALGPITSATQEFSDA